jgi:hypothetical protein
VGADAVHVRDLGSCNGTRVNGMQIGRPRHWHLPPALLAAPFRGAELHDGDELCVGDAVLAVALADLAEDRFPSEADTDRDEESYAACAGCGHGLALQGARPGAY